MCSGVCFGAGAFETLLQPWVASLKFLCKKGLGVSICECVWDLFLSYFLIISALFSLILYVIDHSKQQSSPEMILFTYNAYVTPVTLKIPIVHIKYILCQLKKVTLWVTLIERLVIEAKGRGRVKPPINSTTDRALHLCPFI